MFTVTKIYPRQTVKALNKCRCGGIPDRLPLTSMREYYTVECQTCKKRVSDYEADDAEQKWNKENE